MYGYEYEGLAISQIIVAIEIEIEIGIGIGIGIDPWPSWTAQTSLPSCVNTAIIRLRYPVSHVRIPSRVLSIATPTPILLRYGPFRTTAGEKSPATEITENTEAHVFSHLNATRLK